MESIKFILKLVVTYAVFASTLWGVLQAYTYFQGDALKLMLGNYWWLIYLLPLPLALIAVTKRNQNADSTAPIKNKQITNIEGGPNSIANVQGETVHVYVNNEGKLADTVESKDDSLIVDLGLLPKTGLGSSVLVTVTNRHSKNITIRDVSLILKDDNNDEVSVSYMNLKTRHSQLSTDIPIKLGESDSCEFLFPIYFIRLQREDHESVPPQITRVLISDTYGEKHAFPPDEPDSQTEFQSLQREFRDLWINNVSPAETSNDTDLLDDNPSGFHGLNQAPADFVGREDELSELTNAIKKERKSGVIISGIGGIGKTALARTLAHQLSRYFQDGRIELNLRGTDSIPRRAEDVMSSIIHQFDRHSSLPEELEQLITRYQSCLQKKKVLLLMDNVANAEQLHSLCLPSTCALVATSRQQFTLPGFTNIELQALSPSYAISFLLELAPRIDNHADAVAKLCGYLPLALRLAGSTLKVRQDLSVEDYIRRLSITNNRLKELDAGRKLTHEKLGVEASLALSYELLADEHLQRSWCALAVFPDTFDASAARGVWDIPMDEAQDVLGNLRYYSLIEYDLGTTRYRLHDLARIFAASFLSKEQQITYRKHHAIHFRDVLQKANRLYREGHGSLRRGLILFDLEWENINAAFEWASEHSKTDNEIAKICNSYPNVSFNIIALRLSANERIRWRTMALRAAQQLGERLDEGKHLAGLAVAHDNLDNISQAIDLNNQALAIFREFAFKRGEANVLGNLANEYSRLGEVEKAISQEKQSLRIERLLGDDPINEAHSLNNLGIFYKKTGDMVRASESYHQALKIYQEKGHRLGESHALGNIGSIYHKSKDYKQAIECFEKQLLIARELKNQKGEANALRDIGTINQESDNYDDALEFLKQSITIYDQIGNRSGKVMALDSMSETYEKKGDLDSAKSYYQRAAALAHDIGDAMSEFELLDKISLVLYKLGDIVQAKEYAQAALAVFGKITDKKAKDSLNKKAVKIGKRLAKWDKQKPH